MFMEGRSDNVLLGKYRLETQVLVLNQKHNPWMDEFGRNKARALYTN